MTWLTAAEQAARNAKIMELFAMGFARREIAKRVDLTTARVSQVINSLGYTFRGEVGATDRDRRRKGADGGAT